MREIKFRMWNNQFKKFHYGIEAFECAMQQFCDIYDHVGLKDAVFEQFTGITDKTGKEIFEGDVINLTTLGTVLCGGVLVELSDFLGAHYWQHHNGGSNDYLIIGNVHENPELIKL